MHLKLIHIPCESSNNNFHKNVALLCVCKPEVGDLISLKNPVVFKKTISTRLKWFSVGTFKYKLGYKSHQNLREIVILER